MKKRLTDELIDELAATGKRYSIGDTVAPGLRLRVSATGTRTFAVAFKDGRSTKYKTLGRFPKLSLERARQQAFVLRGERAAAGELGKSYDLPTVRALVDEYVAYLHTGLQKQKRAEAVRGHLYRDVVPSYGELGIADFKRSDVRQLLNSIAQRARKQRTDWDGSAIQTKVLSSLKGMYVYAVQAYDLAPVDDPTLYQKIERPKKRRKKGLSKPNVITLWKALAEAEPIHRIAMRFLLVVGQRRTETLSMRWDEITENDPECDGATTWFIPGTRTKNGRDHIVALSGLALDLLEEARTELEGTEHVFPSAHGKPGHYNPDTLTKQVIRARESWGVPRVTPHLLRHTCSEQCFKICKSLDVVEAMLNHTPRGVTGDYVAGERLTGPVREVLMQWAAKLRTWTRTKK